MRRGYTLKGETCEVPGVGPIPVAAAAELAADSLLCGILYEGEDITGVAHLGRTIPAKVRTALLERDKVCVVSGCDKMCCLEFDHVTEFAKGGSTSLANLVRMCHWHHYLKTYHGYRLERANGRWVLSPPQQPGPGPVQPALIAGRPGAEGSSGRRLPQLTLVRKNPIRQVPGSAGPRKRKGSWGSRPRHGQDPNDPLQRPPVGPSIKAT